MARPLTVAHVGLGPIGQAVARIVLQTEGLRIVGATDPSPQLAGKDLGSVLGLSKKLRLRVEGNPERFFRKVRANVAVLTTSSVLKEVRPQVVALLARGINVLTTCQELAFPTPATQAAFRELDRLARRKKVSLLATGVNPGFAMDTLALVLSAACTRVNRISVTRVVDAAGLRLSLQRKVGVGLNLPQFRRAVTEGTVRHVGLVQSAHMIAAALGWKLARVDETLEPAVAPRDLDTDYLRVPAGAVAGIHQAVRGYRDGQLAVSLDLQAYVGAEAPRDHVLIDAEPPIDATITGGVAEDAASAALVVNSIPHLLAAPAGLRTMQDLHLLHALNPADLPAALVRKR